MSEVRIRENESLESALRRFKRKTARDGILAEARKREHYEKPSVKRKKKAEAARKRKYYLPMKAPLKPKGLIFHSSGSFHNHCRKHRFFQRIKAGRMFLLSAT